MVNIVLLEPEIPANTGNIGRTCVATGSRLHLIKPLGFDISEKAVRRAGMDYWFRIDLSVYENYNDFLEKNPGASVYGDDKGEKNIHRSGLQRWGLSDVRKGKRGNTGGNFIRKSGKLCADTNAS